MTKYLPPNLLALFAPRPPLPFKHTIKRKRRTKMSGLAHLLKEDPTKASNSNNNKQNKQNKQNTEIKKEEKEEVKMEEGEAKEEGEMSEEQIGVGVFEDPSIVDYKQFERKPTKKELKEKEKQEKQEKHKRELVEKAKEWNPKEDPNTTSDPFKTLFVARLSYSTTETTLRNELEAFGAIKKVRIVCDNQGNPRGYAFVEFEQQRDMKDAYKHADGKKIDGRRIVVDYERGRTVKGWLPRRLGGGKGSTRASRSSSSSSSHSSSSYSSSSSSHSSSNSSRSSSHTSSSSSRRRNSRGNEKGGESGSSSRREKETKEKKESRESRRREEKWEGLVADILS